MSLDKLSHAADVGSNLRCLRIYPTQLNRLAVRKRIQSFLCDVEAGVGVVYCEHIDALSLVVEPPAGTALERVPALNGLRPANIRGGNVALLVPPFACDETIFTIGAGYFGERARVVVIASVVGD